MKITRQLIALSLVALIFVSACSKDNENDNKETPEVKLTNKQMLTAHTWQVAETFQNLSNTRTHYLRGGENTTGVNVGAMKLKFNEDGTGTNTDVSGSTYNMTWSFTSTDERNLRLTVNGTVVYDWIFTSINEEVILQTSLVSTNGILSTKWIPVP